MLSNGTEESKDCCDFVRLDAHALDVTSQIGIAAVADNNKKNTCRNSSGSSENTLRTYKRRKTTPAHDEKVSQSLETQVKQEVDDEVSHIAVNKSFVQSDNVGGTGVCNGINAFDADRIKHWRNFFLQQMFASLEGENGLKGCIQDALDFHSENARSPAVKESVHSCEDLRKRASFSLSGARQNVATGIEDATFTVPGNAIKVPTVTELCQRAFFDVVTSEKFALLCRVLGDFEGAKANSCFSIGGIDSKIKEGAYEGSPVLFLSDIEQLWMKLQHVGLEIVNLTKSLIKKSRTAYHEQVGDILPEVSDDVNLEFVTQESSMHTKGEQTQGNNNTYKTRSCKCCKERADVRDSLVCDSCEDMYHVSCIKPAVREIPSRSWYCAICTSRGLEPPHDQCVVCERLTASRLLANNISGVDELEESSNNQVESDFTLTKGKDKVCCNVCRTNVQNGEELKVCGHAFCPHKYYHSRCLSEEKLTFHGPVWYCPSCLCRVCLIDCEDDKIVLCDACDEAYHIYCMHPPRTMIPPGKWFCTKCDSEIRLIRKAKRTYEKMQCRLSRNNHSDVGPTGSVTGKVKEEEEEEEEPLESSGAMDMLLKAATLTLNNEDHPSVKAH